MADEPTGSGARYRLPETAGKFLLPAAGSEAPHTRPAGKRSSRFTSYLPEGQEGREAIKSLPEDQLGSAAR